MRFSDDDLFDFDTSRLAKWDRTDPQALLERHPDLYRNHLAIAKWTDEWIASMKKHPTLKGEYQEGFVKGIREIAAHLRQGDLLPGGSIYDSFAG